MSGPRVSCASALDVDASFRPRAPPLERPPTGGSCRTDPRAEAPPCDLGHPESLSEIPAVVVTEIGRWRTTIWVEDLEPLGVLRVLFVPGEGDPRWGKHGQRGAEAAGPNDEARRAPVIDRAPVAAEPPKPGEDRARVLGARRDRP